MVNQVDGVFSKAEYQDSPLRVLLDFLSEEEKNESSANYSAMRFVGYVLELGFDEATVITSDAFKKWWVACPEARF